MTDSDAMMATSAELAIDWPNVGPIEFEEESPRPKRESSAFSTRSTSGGSSCDVEIWKTFWPKSGSSTDWSIPAGPSS